MDKEEGWMAQNRILVVDDEQLIRWSLATSLSKSGYITETAGTGAEALAKLASFRPDVVLLDVFLPDANGLDLLMQMKGHDPDLVVIIITANSHMDSAVEALKRGAEDFIGKPFNISAIHQTINQALEKRTLNISVNACSQSLTPEDDYDRLVGTGAKMMEVFKMIKVCAEAECKTVLILGESGTGKELVARALHQHSPRRDKPFIDVNCAAIPENLLENELFGHEKGAFTSAANKEKGIFAAADGGTVFLDEIGDMPLAMQAKILKVIENKRYRRLGSNRDSEVDVRIIAATNQNLLQMVQEGTFRGDLFFRLNVLSIQLPPLRERKENLPHIASYFVEKINRQYGKKIEGLSPEALECLNQYSWPGNCRELKNVIERAMIMEQGALITPKFFPAEVRSGGGIPAQTTLSNTPVMTSEPYPYPPDPLRTLSESLSVQDPSLPKVVLPPEGISIEAVEKAYIMQALARYGGNQTRAAKCLGMSLDTLRYRRKKFGLENYPQDEHVGGGGEFPDSENDATSQCQ